MIVKTGQFRNLRQNAGLTLVEVLIAISLGAMAAGILFTTFLGSQNVYIKTRNDTGTHGDARVVLGLFANEIRSAGSDASGLGLSGQGIVLASADSLHLTSDLNGDGIIGVSEPPEDVIYAYDSATGTVTRDVGAGAVVLLDRIASMNLRYLDSDGQALTATANGHVDPDFVRAVEVALSVRKPDGTTEDLKGIYSFRAR